MSRRASVFAKENPGVKPKGVRFPDELVFLDSIKVNDISHMHDMLRRASIQLDISAINDAGLTPLHQAVLDDNMLAVRLLVGHGADVNKQDEDTWSPLHAACAEGHIEIAKYLLKMGASKDSVTDEGERPIDLVDSENYSLISLLLDKSESWKDDYHLDDVVSN
ncbi:protein phosphatase 1 regulatory subunit 27-like [Tubulanus polymorphus]|uniref:protein phosphatase 1 regulatory subunit 27-like n=1 Tax=Tubulanus polymorphus TaxID=672921 RepID=UPI003DA4A4D8